MACPYEDHDIDVRTIGRCVYCGKDVFNNVEAWIETFEDLVEVHPA